MPLQSTSSERFHEEFPDLPDIQACEVCGVKPHWLAPLGLTPIRRPYGIYCLFTCEECDTDLGGHRKRRRIIGY